MTEVSTQTGIATLTPGYFAGVMATGIVCIGAQLKGLYWLSATLFWISVVFYATLVVLNIWRFVAHRRSMSEDFHDPARAFGFFTFIAATDVLGTALVGTGHFAIATVLLVIALLTWIGLGYVVPWTAVLGNRHRPMLDKANGTWFIWVVASQSIAVVAAGLEPHLPRFRDYLAVTAVFSWSLGLILYGGCAVFVALRAMLYRLGPQDLDPPYWVTMGAMAITVVAGSRVVEMEHSPMVEVTRGLAAGLSVVFWSFATWLIPVLFAAGIWRHAVHKIPLRYQPTLWSLVFPLGMYSVAGMYLGRADHLPFVEAVGTYWFWVGLTAWVLTAAAMCHDIVSRWMTSRRAPAGPPPPHEPAGRRER